MPLRPHLDVPLAIPAMYRTVAHVLFRFSLKALLFYSYLFDSTNIHFHYQLFQLKEKFEYTKGVIRSRTSKKNRQFNVNREKTNNDQQNTTQKIS
jgi:hypothetical protein